MPMLNDPFARREGPLAGATRMRAAATPRRGGEAVDAARRENLPSVEEAAWRLVAGDCPALPAFFAVAGALPAGERATVVLEVPGPGDEQVLAAGAGVRVIWLHR